MNRQARCYLRITRRVQGMPGEAPPRSRSKMDSLIFIPDLVKTTKAEESVAVVGREPLPVSQSEEQKFIEQETGKETEIEPKNASVQRRVDLYKLSNIASVWFLGLFMSIILTSVLELRWSGVGIEDLWRNEQFWVIGGVSAHLFAVFQGFLKMLAGLDTNFTVTSKASDDGEFGELYIFKWTTLLIPPTTLLVVNMVGVVAGFSDALNSGYESWGPLFGMGKQSQFMHIV